MSVGMTKAERIKVSKGLFGRQVHSTSIIIATYDIDVKEVETCEYSA